MSFLPQYCRIERDMYEKKESSQAYLHEFVQQKDGFSVILEQERFNDRARNDIETLEDLRGGRSLPCIFPGHRVDVEEDGVNQCLT